nr:aspartic proteinase nepenthesin-2-like [Malus domestica]
MARLTYLEAKAHYFTDEDIRVGLVPRNTAEFMANISIREPQVPQLISIDSGSNVVWVQRLPCTKCLEQTSPIFYPSKSSTYTQFPCSSSNCTINDDKCDPSNNYKFSRRYAGGSIVDGLVGTEKFTFETSDEGISTVPDVVFGCASHTDPHYGKASGILGLGPLKIIFGKPNKVKILSLHR